MKTPKNRRKTKTEPTLVTVPNADRVAGLPNSWDLAYLTPSAKIAISGPEVEAAIAKVLLDSVTGEKAPKSALLASTGRIEGEVKGRLGFYGVTNNVGGSLVLLGGPEPIKIKLERGLLVLVAGYTSYVLERTDSRQRHVIVYSGF